LHIHQKTRFYSGQSLLRYPHTPIKNPKIVSSRKHANPNDMLANLDNELHFKKVFTDVEVFTAFVKDVLGIELPIHKIEAEELDVHRLYHTSFRANLFGFDKNGRLLVHLQKAEHAYHFNSRNKSMSVDRPDLLRECQGYDYGQEAYAIVVISPPSTVISHLGSFKKVERPLRPAERGAEFNHHPEKRLAQLNIANNGTDTPPAVLDWLQLFRESIRNPEAPKINTANPAIAKAAQLSQRENLSADDIYEARIVEMRKTAREITYKEGMEAGISLGREQAPEATKAKSEEERQKIEAEK